MYLCLHMSTYNNWILSLNNQRSMNEEAVAWNLGYELQAHYPPKPIIFVGWEYVGSYIESQMRTDPSAWNGNLYIRAYRRLQGGQDPANLRSAQTNVNSVLTWSVQTDDMMQQWAYQTMDGDNRPMCDVVMVKLPEGYNGFFIHMDHRLIDSCGLVVMVNDLMQLYTHYRFGSDYPTDLADFENNRAI